MVEPGGDYRRGGVCQIRSLVTPAVASPSEAASNLKMEMKCIVPRKHDRQVLRENRTRCVLDIDTLAGS